MTELLRGERLRGRKNLRMTVSGIEDACMDLRIERESV
jgi:hypothetical protein